LNLTSVHSGPRHSKKLNCEGATIKAYYEYVSEEGVRWNNEL
jgi:hypothetical protein